jgi:predicted amino acid-binding ACT domain protein
MKPIQTMSNVTLSILPTMTIDGVSYHNAKDMLTLNPGFFKGVTTTPRRIIDRKKIPATDYVYATLEKGKEWNISTDKCKKAQLLISTTWINANRFFCKTPVVSASNAPNEATEATEATEEMNAKDAPPIIHLSDAEKFHDVDGRVIEIETRGERHEDKIYFKVKHVSIGFEMPSLNHVLVNMEGGYKRGIDYITFKRCTQNVSKNTNKLSSTTLYLTYEGLLRVLFVSRNKNATLFRKWATQMLFTIQMGSKEQKVKLGTDLCNIPLKTYKAIFESHTSNFPSIYLLALGKVRDLRATFGIGDTIPDDSVVYKYGFTRDFARRIGEHQQAYSKLPGVTVDVKWFQNIDIKYLSDAENEVEEECSAYGTRLQVPDHKELIVLNNRQFDHMQKTYRRIGKEYAGATAELNEKIEELRAQIKDMDMQHRHALLEKDFIIQRVTMQHERDTMMFALKEDNYKLQLQLQMQSKSSQ